MPKTRLAWKKGKCNRSRDVGILFYFFLYNKREISKRGSQESLAGFLSSSLIWILLFSFFVFSGFLVCYVIGNRNPWIKPFPRLSRSRVASGFEDFWVWWIKFEIVTAGFLRENSNGCYNCGPHPLQEYTFVALLYRTVRTENSKRERKHRHNSCSIHSQ